MRPSRSHRTWPGRVRPPGPRAASPGALAAALGLLLGGCASAGTGSDDGSAVVIPSTPCKTAADCPDSFACRAHAAMPRGVAVGQCYPAGAVAVIDGERCTPGAGRGTRAAPFCEPAEAQAQGFTLLVLRPRATSYAALSVSSGSVTVIGPGRDAPMPAVLGGARVPAREGDLSLWDLALRGRDSDFVATCSAGQLALHRVAVEQSRGGIDASAGCTLTVERSRLRDLDRAALRMDSSVRYRVINSLIAANGAAFTAAERSSMVDLVIDLASSLRGNRFVFNTVAQNQGGLVCRPGQVLTASLLLTTTGARPIPDPSCSQLSSFTGPDNAPQLGPQYQLTEGSTGCIDQAGGSAPEPPDPDGLLDTDYHDTPRPQRRGFDIGFFELP